MLIREIKLEKKTIVEEISEFTNKNPTAIKVNNIP
jgi:hypothetical protein